MCVFDLKRGNSAIILLNIFDTFALNVFILFLCVFCVFLTFFVKLEKFCQNMNTYTIRNQSNWFRQNFRNSEEILSARIDTINLKWEIKLVKRHSLQKDSVNCGVFICSFIKKFLNFDCDYNFDCSKKNLKQIRQNMYDLLEKNSNNDKVLLFTLIKYV